jgi:hypothetical protein
MLPISSVAVPSLYKRQILRHFAEEKFQLCTISRRALNSDQDVNGNSIWKFYHFVALLLFWNELILPLWTLIMQGATP